MRVLVVANAGPAPGGHRIQALATTHALKDLGVDVSFTNSLDARPDGYDIVHAFGVPREGIRAARRAGALVVVSPIWWSAAYQLSGPPATPSSRLAGAVRVGASVTRNGIWKTARRLVHRLEESALMFESADMLLPNSTLEARQIRQDLEVTTPMHVVPNAVDPDLFSPPAEDSRRRGVLYVGRLEPHKNQLGLIRELNGSGIPLMIVGPEHPHHADYAAKCRREADCQATFLRPRDQKELAELYRGAAVHAMPSWFETTGLSSLEAGATGATVVTTNRGYASEYFEDLATYCDPAVHGSIRSAVMGALESTLSSALRDRIVERYTWRHAAVETSAAYLSALGWKVPADS